MPNPAKPTVLKLLQGNPGKRAISDKEPKPKCKAPSCPAWLDSVAKEEWRRGVKQLETLGLLSHIDRSAYAAYCQCFSRWKKAEAILEKEGLTFVTDSGYIQQHPAVGIANTALDHMRKFANEFGMTPASRTKIRVEPAGKEDDFEEFLTRGESAPNRSTRATG